MEDKQIVQTPEPVEGATGESEGETPKVSPTPEPDKLAELEARLREDFGKQLEEKDSHWQSVKDREVKAARREVGTFKRRAESAESRMNAIRTAASRNPQLAAQIKAADLEERERVAWERDSQDRVEQTRKEYFDVMSETIKGLDIDINDPRLDWADDAEDSIAATRRIMSSVSKIKKEEAKKMGDKGSQAMKDLEARLRKELGLDSADKTAPSGAGSSDTDFLTKFGEGDLPYTKENVDRANKLMNK